MRGELVGRRQGAVQDCYPTFAMAYDTGYLTAQSALMGSRTMMVLSRLDTPQGRFDHPFASACRGPRS